MSGASRCKYFIEAFLLSCLIGMSRFFIVSGDYYFMVAYARDMLENGLYRNVDIFAIYDNLGFLYQKWAMCILIGFLYDIGGLLLVEIVGSVMIATLCVFVFYLMNQYNAKYPYMNLAIGVFCMAQVLCSESFRPHIIALFLILLEIDILEKYVNGKLRDVYLICILSVCSLVVMWFHSTMWIMCLLVVVPYLFDIKHKWLIYRGYNKIPVILGILGMIITSIFQPNGLEQYHYMFVCMTAGVDNHYEYVPELQGFDIGSPQLCVLIATLILLLYCEYKIKQMNLSHVLLILGLFILSVVSSRMYLYYLIIYCVVFSMTVSHMNESSKLLKYFDDRFNQIKMLVVCLAICIAVNITGQFARQYYIKDVDAMNSAVIAMKNYANTDNLRVLTLESTFGSYCMMFGMKPSIDCRAEIYDIRINGQKDVLNELSERVETFIHADDSFAVTALLRDVQNEYDFDYIVVRKNVSDDVLDKMMSTNLLTMIYENDKYYIWKILK